ncbi:MAG: metallophosphoesterase [Marinilabiliaceae bacterium]|nr:metallophosphoesterase [Marinilabiliaceae bacterium]
MTLNRISSWFFRPLKLDFIGDVHGYADELEALLVKMGYQYINNVWMHPVNKAVFVGDFINRGPNNRRVIEIIKNMVDNQKGYAILGNHEINAISYFTLKNNGQPIKIPGSSNKRFLDKIKAEYKNDLNTFEKRLKWLRKLPLFYDFGDVRVVHAYWSDYNINLIKGAMPKGKLTKKLLKEINKGVTEVSKAILQTTRGVEFCFPVNMIVTDINKNRKINFRIKWWQSPYNKTYEELKFETKSHLPNIIIPNNIITPYEIYPKDSPPVFIGHYCMNNKQLIQNNNICCVDSCIANNGKLTAYRWIGEKHLKKENLVSVKRIKK